MLWEEKLTLVEVISSLVSLSFFMEQIIKINGQSVRCLLAVVRWFQSHPSIFKFKSPEVVRPVNVLPTCRVMSASMTIKGSVADDIMGCF